MVKHGFIFFLLILSAPCFSQLFVARDTISVTENGRILKMAWANGVNHSNVSSIDLNLDGKKDLAVFDRVNRYGVGRFRCFINTGNPGETKYRADPQMSYVFPQVSSWGVFYDYDHDGLEDLFCSTTLGIMVYKNTSTPANTPNFTLAKPLLYCDYNPGGPPSIFNLYCSSIGVPGIADIDNDGDLDIIDFSSQGVFIELYKNLSIEKYNSPDSLVFEYASSCWGKLSESNCEVEFNACTTSASKPQKVYHAGSCLTCIDSDGDMDQDVILGDVSCSIVQYIHNTGTGGITGAFFSDTTKLYPNYPNKHSTQQIRLNAFPCTYFVDVNDDGKKDLIATPNVPTGENFTSIWYYKNASATSTVDFQFVKKNFLQDEMIEAGQNSFPLVFDYNADGKKDLLIGNYGYFISDTLRARLTLYENTGTAAQPSYSLITRDYAGLGARHLSNAMPTIGDIDNDGDMDICIGVSSGQVHWLENTAGAGHVCDFSVFHDNPFSFTTLSAAAAPQLFDLDNDGKLDLLIGMQNGRIAYYHNTGSPSVPSYSLMTNMLGSITVTDNVNLYGIDGYAVPYFYRDGADTRALVGSVSGNLYHYVVSSDVLSPYYLITPSANNFNEGGQSAPWFEDVNNDGLRDLFIGNASGGLSFFSSEGPNVGIHELTSQQLRTAVSMFPNPAQNSLNISIDKIEFRNGTILVHDLVGKEMLRMPLQHNSEAIDLSSLVDGIYFATVTLEVDSRKISTTQKIIRIH